MIVRSPIDCQKLILQLQFLHELEGLTIFEGFVQLIFELSYIELPNDHALNLFLHSFTAMVII